MLHIHLDTLAGIILMVKDNSLTTAICPEATNNQLSNRTWRLPIFFKNLFLPMNLLYWKFMCGLKAIITLFRIKISCSARINDNYLIEQPYQAQKQDMSKVITITIMHLCRYFWWRQCFCHRFSHCCLCLFCFCIM